MVERSEKIAFITGAASGIGRATADAFSQNQGYKRVFAADIDPAIHNIFNPNKHPRVTTIQLDIRSFRQVDETLRRIVNETGRLDVVVNCAGTILAGKTIFSDEHQSDIDMIANLSMEHTNDFSTRHVVDKSTEIMDKNGGGIIVVITSSKDLFPDPYRRRYERSKSKVEEYSLRKAKKHAGNGVRIVVVKPGNTKTNIDRGSWISPNSRSEMTSVQNFNDWWRKIFGNDPRNVAETIFEIAEGKIKGSKVFVGFDAKLGRFLALTIPGWKSIFYLGSSALYRAITILGKHSKKNQLNSSYSAPVHLSGAWFEEGLRREAETKVSEDQQVVRVGDALYLRVVGSNQIDGNLQGVQVDLKKMTELGISQGALETYLDSKTEELGNKTMLLEDCEPEADGDWKYKYIVDKAGEDTAFGAITVTFKGDVIFNHFITLSRVRNPV